MAAFRDDAPVLSPWLRHLEDLLDIELAQGAPTSPFRPAVLRWAATNGRPVDPIPLLDTLETNRIGCRGGARRYRWSFSVAGWIALDDRLRWRPAEREFAERHGAEHAARLWVPPVLVEHVEWLDRIGRSDGPADVATRARALLAEALPTVEDDVAVRIAGVEAWGDTFLLWAFARRPRALARVPGLVSAIASRYAARADRTDGLVHGRSYPFFDVPMTSATAHLASAAARTGEGLGMVARAVEWLRTERRPDGGWGDPRQPTDVLTTLAVAELLGLLDAMFDPVSVLDAMEAQVTERGGRPAMVGPEWPWLAAELLAFALLERQAVPGAVPVAACPAVDDRSERQRAPQGGVLRGRAPVRGAARARRPSDRVRLHRPRWLRRMEHGPRPGCR